MKNAIKNTIELLVAFVVLVGLAIVLSVGLINVGSFLLGARSEPVAKYETKKIAEIDGCRMYEVRTPSRVVYFANCGNPVTKAQWIEHYGKGQIRVVETDTSK